jgi:peptidoglycan/LPS O-acetylase OafA/YrhL
MSKIKYFDNLDSIRFIAALMVFLGHGVSPSFKYLNIDGTLLEQFLKTISNGEMGVSIFFVLSGFLITYLLINEYNTKNEISVKNFYMRRVLRIWPLYFLVVFFSFLVYPFLKSLIGIESPLGSNVLYHLLFLSNFDVINIQKLCYGSDAMSQNITWSVSVEEQFYLFWPLLFVVFPKRFWKYAIASVIVFSMIFRMYHNEDIPVLYFHTFSVLVDLGIGGLMAYFLNSSKKLKSFFENGSTKHHLFFISLSFCLVFWEHSIFNFPYASALSRIFISSSFAFVIASQALTQSNSRLNLKNISFASKWGKYTYGIYLLHPIALTVIDVIYRVLHIQKDSFWVVFSAGLVGFVLTMIMSKLSYILFESKFLAMKNKYS